MNLQNAYPLSEQPFETPSSQSPFLEEIDRALLPNQPLGRALQACAQSMVDSLDAAFARIWMLPPGSEVFELQASAGLFSHLDGMHSRPPLEVFGIDVHASMGRMEIPDSVQDDPYIGDPAWALREGLIAFVAIPLYCHETLVGVIATFSKTQTTEQRRSLLETAGTQIGEKVYLAFALSGQITNADSSTEPDAESILDWIHAFTLTDESEWENEVLPSLNQLLDLSRQLEGTNLDVDQRRLCNDIQELAKSVVLTLSQCQTHPTLGITAPMDNDSATRNLADHIVREPAPDNAETKTGRRIRAKQGIEHLISAYLSNRQRDLLTIASAVSSGDLNIARVIGHNLKGTGCGYGFPDITALGDALERAAIEGDICAIQMQAANLADYLESLEVEYP